MIFAYKMCDALSMTYLEFYYRCYCYGCLRCIFAIVSGMLIFVAPLCAEETPQKTDPAQQYGDIHIGFAAGYGQRSNPLVDGDDIDIYWVADLSWYGKRWFFDNGDIGYSYYENKHMTLSFIGSLNSDRVFFSHLNDGFLGIERSAVADVDDEPLPSQVAVSELSREQQAALIDSPDRDYAFEIGMELLADGAWGFIQTQFNSDISSVHNGHELWVKYGYDWYKRRWHIQPSIAVSWKSAEFNNYYFGVRTQESSRYLPTYETGSGLNYSFKLSVQYIIDEHFSLISTLEFEKLNSGASDSPFIFDDHITSFFTGVFYRF